MKPESFPCVEKQTDMVVKKKAN